MDDTAQRFYSTHQAAVILGEPVRRVLLQCQTGAIPAAKVGKQYRIPASWFESIERRAHSEAQARRRKATQP